MTTTLLIGAGVFLLIVAAFDAVTTTIRVGRGAGLLTGRLAAATWRIALATHRRRRVRSILAFAGPAILITTLGVWVILAWAGWTLIFAAAEGAVVRSPTGVPADTVERFWFAGQTIVTLGTGDFRPEPPAARVATAVAALNGLSLVTLGISYVLPVVSAVAGKRGLAGQIGSLGGTPDDIVQFARTAPEAFAQYMTTLVPPLTLVTEQHLAYPVLHYFHADQSRTSAAVAVARLDEALTVLLGEESAPARRESLQPVRRAIGLFLDTLSGRFVDSASEPPPMPTGATRDADTDQRRSLLLALVVGDGYEWEDVTGRGR